jgi:hypothetical protein
MSDPTKILHLVIEGLPGETRREIEEMAARSGTNSEILPLDETTAPAALEKIFAADSVKVWSPLLK